MSQASSVAEKSVAAAEEEGWRFGYFLLLLDCLAFWALVALGIVALLS